MSETVTLKEYFTKILEDLEKHWKEVRTDDQKAVDAALAAAKEAVAAALTAAKKAVEEAKKTQDQQLQSHNGLIRKMEIQTNTFIPRQESEVQFKALEDKLNAAIRPLNDYVLAQQGQQKGTDKTWQVIVTIIGVGITIVGFIGLKG